MVLLLYVAHIGTRKESVSADSIFHPDEYLKYQITRKYLLIPAAFKEFLLHMENMRYTIEPYSLVQDLFNAFYNTEANFLEKFEFEFKHTRKSPKVDEFHIINNKKYLSLLPAPVPGTRFHLAVPTPVPDQFSEWTVEPDKDRLFRFVHEPFCLKVSQYASGQQLTLIGEQCMGNKNELFYIISLFVPRERIGFFESKETFLPTQYAKYVPDQSFFPLKPIPVLNDPNKINTIKRILENYAEHDKLTTKSKVQKIVQHENENTREGDSGADLDLWP